MTVAPPAHGRLRVLHVTDSYLPTVGGIELHIADLAERQQRRGHLAHILTRTGGMPIGECVVHAPPGRPCLPHRPIRLGEVLSADAGYDVVHVHASVYSPLAWQATLARARQQQPVVFTAHSMLTGVTRPYRTAATALRLRRLPVTWSAVSSAAARSLSRGMGLAQDAVRVLPNAVDPGDWSRVSVRPEPDTLTFVAVMRLAARKRPRALLEVFREAAVSPAARLVVVGDGPRAEAYRRWCRAHPYVHVTLLGQLDRRQIRSVLGRADVFLAPATRESFGIAALEAHESGLPVVGRSATGVADFIDHGVDGLLVGSDTEMADAIRTLTDDRPLLRKLTAATGEHSSGYDWPNAVARADAAYRDAVARCAGRGQDPRVGHTGARNLRRPSSATMPTPTRAARNPPPMSPG